LEYKEKKMTYMTNCPDETEKIAYDLAKTAKAGEVYCLVGDLGVGKTLFTKGFAKGIGINEYITSPTFTLVNEYDANVKFNHFDVYRIEHISELEEIGFDDYIYSDAITLIEWADMIEELIPEEAIWINIEKDLSKGEDYRTITIKK